MIPTITIDFNKECYLCGRAGATEGGLCMKCIEKKLRRGDYDHTLKAKKQLGENSEKNKS